MSYALTSGYAWTETATDCSTDQKALIHTIFFLTVIAGTGKTLAYLVPIVHHLREEQDQGVISRLNRPRALIVLPNRELAFQVLVSGTTTDIGIAWTKNLQIPVT